MAFIQGTINSKPVVRNITWTKDTVPITLSDKTKYKTSGSILKPELKIFDVQEADKGTYSCAAYNGYDTGTGTLVINVGGNYMIYGLFFNITLYFASFSLRRKVFIK